MVVCTGIETEYEKRMSQETFKEAESKGPDGYVYRRGAEGVQCDTQVSGFDCWAHGRPLTQNNRSIMENVLD